MSSFDIAGSVGGAAGAELAPDHYRRQLETVAQNATLALFIMDERQHCTFMNPAAERLTGYTLSEVQGRPLHDVIHHTRPDGTPYPLEECPIDRAFPENMREQGEDVFVHKDGHFYPVAFTASPIRDGDRTVGTIIEARNISEERRAREEREELLRQLKTERTRLQTLFQQAPAFIATLRGPDHVFEMTNAPYLQLIGHREVLGRPVREALPEVVEQGFVALLDQVYQTGEPYVGTEVRVLLQRYADGALEERFLNFVYQPLVEPDGGVSGIMAHGVDVTDLVYARQRAEEQAMELEAQAEELQNQATQLEEVQLELEVSNDELQQVNAELARRTQAAEQASTAAEAAGALLDAFFEGSPVAAAFLDRDLRYRRINSALAAIDGIDPAEVLGRTLHEVLPHAAAHLEPLYRQVLDTGVAIRNLEISVPRPTAPDAMGHYLVNYFPVQVRPGEVLGVGLVALDISERKAMEERERTLAQVMEESRNEIYLFDAATLRFVQVNRGARENLGYSMDELRELTPLDLKPEFSREEFSRLLEPLRSGEQEMVRFETVHHRKDGSVYPVDVHLQLSHSGERPVFVALILDITERKEGERELLRAKETAEEANQVKSAFLATMSHELRTPLNAMLGYTDLLLMGVPEPIPPAALAQVERIGLSARHLLELIEEILTFARIEAGRERIEVEPVRVEDLTAEVSAIIQPLASRKELQFTVEIPDDPIVLETDPRKVRQILLNVLGNAVKFTQKGRIHFRVECGGEDAVFCVQDTGIGIAAQHLQKIFEPFWQEETEIHARVEGTGLGLPVTRRLAELLGGSIEVESRQGEGTSFTIRLPLRAGIGAPAA